MIYHISPSRVHLWTLILALTLFVVTGVTAKSYEEDMRITAKEKRTLEKFKELMIPQIPETSIVHNYINDDLYFIRWLRAASFDIGAAERKLLDHLRWRKEENMDTIDEEDWSSFQKKFPLFVDTHDKEGRPAVEVWLGDWDVRKAVQIDNGRMVVRWLVYALEMGQRQLFEARAKGRKVSQIVTLGDSRGFNAVQHTCPRCLAAYVTGGLTLISNYPEMLEGIYVVNMIPAFDTIVNLLKPLLGRTYEDLFTTYVRKSEWEPIFDAKFENSQRSFRFGGTKARDNLS